jgi:hypothetical protein
VGRGTSLTSLRHGRRPPSGRSVFHREMVTPIVAIICNKTSCLGIHVHRPLPSPGAENRHFARRKSDDYTTFFSIRFELKEGVTWVASETCFAHPYRWQMSVI